jgi:hypothetical protein
MPGAFTHAAAVAAERTPLACMHMPARDLLLAQFATDALQDFWVPPMPCTSGRCCTRPLLLLCHLWQCATNCLCVT